ncbi:MAG: hypothetical protein HY651_06720 [Acidobacteria bacterium]|nr:hypothetical protein [Acidobacteriota bacterium]
MKPQIQSTMNNGKLVASVLLILIGFCAGVGMNLLPIIGPMTGTVQGAPGDPNPALKSVAHDATLAGDGTSSAPLGVANRGIPAPKLSATTPPSLGQILGFNGANLAWQNAPVGGVGVLDDLGKDVGPLWFGNYVVRKIAGPIFTLKVNAAGFVQSEQSDVAEDLYTTPDCSGTAYASRQDPNDLVIWAQVIGTRLYYVVGSEQVTIRSHFSDSDHFCYGPAVGWGPYPATKVGHFVALDIASLNLTPPFHLEF